MAQDVIVRIQGLNKTFRGRAGTVVALNGIDLDIYRGEIFGIIGLSGAGKSTLVRCINFLEKPTEGTVTVDGDCVTLFEEKTGGLDKYLSVNSDLKGIEKLLNLSVEKK